MLDLYKLLSIGNHKRDFYPAFAHNRDVPVPINIWFRQLQKKKKKKGILNQGKLASNLVWKVQMNNVLKHH